MLPFDPILPVDPLPVEDYELDGTLEKRFERVAEHFSERLAVKEFQRSFTYRRLNQAANRLGRAILDRLGEKPEPVALLLSQHIDTVPALLAVIKAGKVYAVLSTGDPPAQLNINLAALNPRLILVDSGTLAAAEAAAPSSCSLLNVTDVDPETSCENIGLPLTADRSYAIYLTSGSTGAPKGILREHRTMLERYNWCFCNLKLTPGDRISHMSHFSFSVSQGDMFNALLTGASMNIYPMQKLGINPLADWLRREQITLFHPSIAFLRVFLSTLDDADQFPGIRQVQLGGDTLYRSDVERLYRHIPPVSRILHAYSSTEASVVTSFIFDRNTNLAGDIVPAGYAVMGKKVFIFDDQRRPLPPGETGEIAVRSPLISSGYFNQPDLTGEKFIADPADPARRIYLTGDLGRLLPDGCLQFLGRKDFMVKVRGYRVELSAIEAALLSLPGVKNACAIARPTDAGEKEILAYVTFAAAPPPDPTAIRRALAVKLPEYALPSRIVLLDDLPLTPTGKVDRAGLPGPT